MFFVPKLLAVVRGSFRVVLFIFCCWRWASQRQAIASRGPLHRAVLCSSARPKTWDSSVVGISPGTRTAVI